MFHQRQEDKLHVEDSRATLRYDAICKTCSLLFFMRRRHCSWDFLQLRLGTVIPTDTMASKTQELQQTVCQRFGWSFVFTQLEDGKWKAEIIVGLEKDHPKHTYVTTESFDDDKDGKSAVSELALKGLADTIAAWGARPAKELTQVFASVLKHLPLLDSRNPTTWQRFWSTPHTAVGIDAEGNGISPPVLVQIATLDFVILETRGTTLSSDLQRLLRDDSITKVFCDNFNHKDKQCLGLPVTRNDPDAYAKPPVVDLESLSMHTLGPVKSARGLAKIVSLTMPELNVRIEKPSKATGGMKGRFSNIAKFALIEQGKMKALRGLSDLTKREQEYAALDAWCTLKVYERIQQLQDERIHQLQEG
jgi:hypothetical protein